jgi:hypothetical protein
MMATIQIHPAFEPRPIHPKRLAKVLTDITNLDLREAIIGADRFAARIAALLLPVAAREDHGGRMEPVLARLLDAMNDTFLIRIGQLWYAPVLAARILAPLGRSGRGLDDRDSLRRVLAYRDHTKASVVGALPAEPDFGQEGALCVLAWLEGRKDSAAAQRIRLILAPHPDETIPAQAERAALVERILADTDLCGD